MGSTQRLFQGLTFKVADYSERERALDLRRRIYTVEHGTAGLDEFDDVAIHLVAIDQHSAIVAALRLVASSYRPFDFERFISLDRIVSRDAIPAEVSRFCVERTHRAIHRGQVVHLGMLKLLYEFASHKGITDLLALVLPEMEIVYKVAFFVPLDITVEHPVWGPARIIHLDLIRARMAYENSKHPVARLLFRTNVPNIILSE